MVRLHLQVLPDHPDFHAFLDEFQGESDRAAAVLAGAYLDTLLEELLAASCVDTSAPVKELLSNLQQLGGFSARIRSTYAFGLITEPERADLHRVKRVRDKFAHERHGLTFQDQSVTGLIAAFECNRERFEAQPDLADSYPREARELFDLAVALLSYYLTIRVRRASRYANPQPPLWLLQAKED